MNRTRTAQLGLYAILVNGDYSALKFNKSLLAFRYRIDIVPLDEFERKYAGVFEAEAPALLVQDVPIRYADSKKQERTVCISSHLERAIRERYPQYVRLLERGYVVLLKTFKTLRTDRKGWNGPEVIREYLLEAYEFCQSFRACLKLTVGDQFSLGDFFGCAVGSSKIIKYKERARVAKPSLSHEDEVEKDRSFLREFLEALYPKAGYIELAVALYLEALGTEEHKLRFIQLMHCLEACLNTSVPDPAAHITARHAAALVSPDKPAFRRCYFEVVELYKIRNELIYEDLSGTARLTLLEKEVEYRLDMLDQLIRAILRKLIGLNYHKKEQLIEELELLTF